MTFRDNGHVMAFVAECTVRHNVYTIPELESQDHRMLEPEKSQKRPRDEEDRDF